MTGNNGFLRFTVNDFADAYKKYGQDVQHPAIISNAVSTKLSGLLQSAALLANAVSLFLRSAVVRFPSPA